jgi:lipid II:glycine glycyltransferase (peptidoglycan interpeptide bridge formation enzyme)
VNIASSPASVKTVPAPLSVRGVAEADWPEYAQQFRDLSFEQSLTYGRAAAARIGGKLRCLVLERDGQQIAAAQVRIKTLPGLGRGIAWIASGPLLLPVEGPAPEPAVIAEVFAALRTELVLRQGHILRLRLPGIAFHAQDTIATIAKATGFAPTDRAPVYRSIAIDLSQDQTALMTALNGKWRTDLRYAQKSGLTLETGYSPDMQARFLVLFRDIQAAKGFAPDITPEFHFALSGPDLSYDILIITKDGQDLAGIVIGTSGLCTVYLFGATAEAGRALRAGYMLTWEGIRLAQGRGMHWYDLGGVDFDENPDVARFKDRMNGQTIEAAGPYEAHSGTPLTHLIKALETLRAKLRKRR